MVFNAAHKDEREWLRRASASAPAIHADILACLDYIDALEKRVAKLGEKAFVAAITADQEREKAQALEKRVAELRAALQSVCDGFRRNDCMDWDELEALAADKNKL